MPAICCELPVLSQTPVGDGFRLLAVRWADADHAPHAGQFFMLRGWAAEQAPTLSRPISVHCYEPQTGLLQFLYQVKGPGTQKLAALQPGERLQLTGPAGNGFDAAACAAPVEGRAPRLALVGGGIGTAPLCQLARELAALGCLPDAYLGFADKPYRLEAFAGCTARLEIATDSGRAGHQGFVTQLLQPQQYDLVLCCGPEPMMRAVAALCRAAGTRCLVSLEKKMACGIGACLGCSCHTKAGAKSVCKNGPVFDAQEVFDHE